MNELTKAEEEIMQQLWTLERAYVKEIIERLPNPKPAYTTVSTIVRILENKGFVDHVAYGKTHHYFPLVSKRKYRKFIAKKMMSGYFDNSVEEMVSFFVKEQKMNLSEADDIMKLIEDYKNRE